jgi:hypothetical protein
VHQRLLVALLRSCYRLRRRMRRAPSSATIVVDVAALDGNGAAVHRAVCVDSRSAHRRRGRSGVSVAPAPSTLNLVLVIDHSSSVPVRRTDLINAIGSQWLPYARARRSRAARAWWRARSRSGRGFPVGRPADTNIARSLLERAGAEPSPHLGCDRRGSAAASPPDRRRRAR